MKANKNAIYNVAGDANSGLLQINDLASAQQFRDRFNSGVYIFDPSKVVYSEDPKADKGGKTKADKQRAEVAALIASKGVIDNGNGTYTVPEVLVKQGNGYDSYGNANAFMRKNTVYAFGAQSLAKYGVLIFDALHQLASGSGREAAEAQQALAVLREFDGDLTVNFAERQKQAQYEKAKQLAIASGIAPEAFDTFWQQNQQQPIAAPVPVAADEDSEVEQGEVAEV